MTLSVNHSQKIAELLQSAEETASPSNKFNSYYKAAKLQLHSELTQLAKASYENAVKIYQSYDQLDDIKNTLKLAKLCLLIYPPKKTYFATKAEDLITKKPYFLTRAEDRITKDMNRMQGESGIFTFGHTYASYFAKLADCFYRLNSVDDGGLADFYLSNAIKRTGGGHPESCLLACKNIAKACIVGYERKLFRPIFPYIQRNLEILDQYSNVEESLSWQLRMAELTYKIDKTYGKTLLASAKLYMIHQQKKLTSCRNFTELTEKYGALLNLMR